MWAGKHPTLRSFLLCLSAAVALLCCAPAGVHADGFHHPLMVYRDPVEYWKKVKDVLGFKKKDDSYEDTLRADPAALQKRLEELQKALGETKDPRKKRALQAEIKKVQAEQALQAMTGLNGSKEDLQRDFMSQLVEGLKFINQYNVRPEEFPEFTRDYKGALTGIGKIFTEIGGPAVPYLWQSVVQELRFVTEEGRRQMQDMQKRSLDLVSQMAELQSKLAQQGVPADQRAKLTEEHHKLAEEQRQITQQLGMAAGLEGLTRNRDFVERVCEVLVEIGAEAAPTLAAELGNPNAKVSAKAAELLRRIGKPALPAIIHQLSIQARTENAQAVLRAMSGEDFGVNAEAWKDCFRKRGVVFPGDQEQVARIAPLVRPTPQEKVVVPQDLDGLGPRLPSAPAAQEVPAPPDKKDEAHSPQPKDELEDEKPTTRDRFEPDDPLSKAKEILIGPQKK